MNLRELYKKEKYVIVNGQTRRFRIVKYLVIFAIAWVLYAWKGIRVVGLTFLFLAIASISVHLFFRWKTHGWEKSWGPYKNI